jgi:pimeloyl-ACP methyl ester carboxylesterase/class 3 adenylate cyclase
MPPPVRYARSGQLSIAYQVIGQGPPDLIWCLGSYSHLDLVWDDPGFARTLERLGETARLLVFDKRGMGLSDRTDTLYTLEERVDDIRAVLDAAESRRAYLMGFSEGGAMAALFAATYPERAEALILYGAPAAYARKPDWPYGATEQEFEERWQALRARSYEEDFTTPDWQHYLGSAAAADAAFLEWWRRLRRSMGSPAARYAQAQMNRLIDVRAILPSIRVPTLLMVRENDPVAPVAMQTWMASQIPVARLVILPGRGHMFHDIWDEWVTEVEQFLTGAPRAAPTQRFLTTLVAVDIVGSTEWVARVGDGRWRDLLARHYERVSRRLTMHAGVEVDRAGDGFLARFDAPARAIRFARDIDREDQALGLRARAAVHTGEVEVSGGALRGIAVHIVSRLTGLASSGEVLVSSTVRDLVGGSGFTFVDRGAHALKGVPEPRQVFVLV